MNQWAYKTYCFDSNQGYPVNVKNTGPMGEEMTEWGDYFNVGGHWLPRTTRESLHGKMIGQVEIKDATVLSPVDPNLFIPPADAEKEVWCDNPTPPKPLRKPESTYTLEARANKVQGTVYLVIRIDTHGNVHDIGVLEPLDAGLDQHAMQTIQKKWKFKPAACGGTPIPAEVEVQVTFRLN